LGAGAISVTSGSSAAVTITANAASTWKTNTGTLTLQSGSGSSDFLILNSGGSSQVQVNGSSVLKLGSSAGDPATCTTGAIVYNSTTNLFRGCQNGSWATLSSTTQTLQQGYTASTGSTTPEIKVDSTRGGVDIQDADSTIGGVLFAVRGTNAGGLGTSLFNVSSSNNTVNIGASGTSTALLVLGADTDASIVNGSTSSAATEVDGAMFYSTTSRSFICGENGAWVSCLGGLRDSSTATSQLTGTGDTNFSGSGNQYTVPANDCVAGRVYRVTAYGTYTNGSTATNGTWKWKFGATTISTLGPTALTTSTTAQWKLEGQITCIDSTHIEAQGEWFVFTNATTAVTITQITNTATLAQVASGTQLLTLSAAVSQTTGTPNITERQLVVEGLGP
jgi:hypothetical protein